MKRPPAREYTEVEYAGGPITEKEEEPAPPPAPVAPGKEMATHAISFNNGTRTVRIRCTEDGEWTFLVIDANGSRLVPVSAMRVDVAE